jgi:hypothetical protein
MRVDRQADHVGRDAQRAQGSRGPGALFLGQAEQQMGLIEAWVSVLSRLRMRAAKDLAGAGGELVSPARWLGFA